MNVVRSDQNENVDDDLNKPNTSLLYGSRNEFEKRNSDQQRISITRYDDLETGKISRATSRSSGSAFYADERDNLSSSEDSLATGSINRLQIKQSSLQPIKRQNSFKGNNNHVR